MQVGESLAEALVKDEAARALRHATLVCEELRREIDDLRAERDRTARWPATQRDWRRIADEVGRLRSASEGLPNRAGAVPGGLSS